MTDRAAAMIFEYLSEGAENARTGRELCEILNITPRELTQAIERERRAGRPICAADQEEMQRYCRSLWRRAGGIHKTRRACLDAMTNLPPGEAQ